MCLKILHMNFSDKNNLLPIEVINDDWRRFMASGLITEEDTVICFYNLDFFQKRMEKISEAFPSNWKHSIAIKSNPLPTILRNASALGFGAEAASFEEVLIGVKSDAKFIVWDSPVKTALEQKRVFEQPTFTYINTNSLEELQELIQISETIPAHIQIGLRINPQQSASAIASMNVSGKRSKFGEPISNRDAIVTVLKKSPIKIGLHVHASSQNINTSETIMAIRAVYELAEEVGWDNIAYFDIGGGYPVDYGFAEVPSIALYAKDLEAAAPKLFNGSVNVITEFGRYYHANAGWTASLVASVKNFHDYQVIIQHAGADLFLRESYEPGKWPHRLFIHDGANILNRDVVLSDVAGPLCFGGDYLAKEVELPKTSKGNWILILDTGANSFALWSKHCSRPFPKIIGIQNGSFQLLKDRDSSEEAVAFWD